MGNIGPDPNQGNDRISRAYAVAQMQAAVIEWTYSVPVKDVAVIGHTGGWEEVFPKEKYIY